MESSPLPHDLAHPRRDRRDRATALASIITGCALLMVLGTLVLAWAGSPVMTWAPKRSTVQPLDSASTSSGRASRTSMSSSGCRTR